MLWRAVVVVETLNINLSSVACSKMIVTLLIIKKVIAIEYYSCFRVMFNRLERLFIDTEAWTVNSVDKIILNLDDAVFS